MNRTIQYGVNFTHLVVSVAVIVWLSWVLFIGGSQADGADIGSPIPSPPAKKSETKTATSSWITTTRAPHGHTHTCANGHTWDHDANPIHICQFCGLSQYNVDSPSRPVTVRTQVTSSVQTQTTTDPTIRYSLYSFPNTSTGCANGNCSAPQSTRWRLFR